MPGRPPLGLKYMLQEHTTGITVVHAGDSMYLHAHVGGGGRRAGGLGGGVLRCKQKVLAKKATRCFCRQGLGGMLGCVKLG